MMLALVLVVAVITVGSRVAALALLPPPRGYLADVVERLPAPLFAALAALSLAGEGVAGVDPALIGAVGLALVAAVRWASLLITLAAGIAGYVVTSQVAQLWPPGG